MENRIGSFSFEDRGRTVSVSLREDAQGWPSVVLRRRGEPPVRRTGEAHEEILRRALGRPAVKALRAFEAARVEAGSAR